MRAKMVGILLVGILLGVIPPAFVYWQSQVENAPPIAKTPAAASIAALRPEARPCPA